MHQRRKSALTPCPLSRGERGKSRRNLAGVGEGKSSSAAFDTRLLARVVCAFVVGLAACSDSTSPLVIETTLVTDTDDTVGPYEVLSVVRDDQRITEAWIFFSTDGRRNFDSVPMGARGDDGVYI